MQIDDQLLEKLQKLGMVTISEDKKEEVKKQLSDIFGLIDNIATLQIEDLPSHLQAKTPMREDIPRDSGIQDDVLAHAPNAKDGFFVVPKIIE